MIIESVIDVLRKADKIAILPHVMVDGDGLGSSLALGLAMQRLGKEACVYLEEEIPYIYSFLPGKELVKIFDGHYPKYDTVVALDAGDIKRLGGRIEIFNSAVTTVNIDHHAINDRFAMYNLVDASKSSVGEIIYNILKTMEIDIEADISTNIYVAIATDTGGFRYSNTTAETHIVAADLIARGTNVAEVSRLVFDIVSVEKVRLIGAAIASLEIFADGQIAFLTVTDKMMRDVRAKEEDCDGIVNIGRNIRGVEVAVMLRQLDNGEIKVNFRSNNFVDVSSIASLYSGGGHKKAAGCVIKGDIQEVKIMLLGKIEEALMSGQAK